ncbi:MAG TPA: fibronectin type III domain-containing protein, partial [Microbacteriaceae bacterium]|nr:fibronectin type III domain-containing protein [Microbacteriaceae bacterium]
IAGATSANYTVGSVVGGLLRVAVTARNAAGATVSTSEPTATVQAVRPGPVTALAVTPADHSLAVTWVAPGYLGGAPITDYIVEYSTDNVAWLQSERTPSANTRHVITGLDNGVAYSVRVRASNGFVSLPTADESGIVPRSEPMNVGAPIVTMHPNSPTAPQIGRAITADAGVWLPNGAPITGVTFQWQVANGPGWSNIAGATASTYTPTGNVGSQLRVLVTATNVSGPTVAASTSTTAILPAAATAPRGLIAAEGDRGFTLSWTAPDSNGGAAIVDYEMQLSTDGDTWTAVSRDPSAATVHTVGNLENGTSYYARVRALNGVNGNWAFLSDITPRGVPVNSALPSVSGSPLFLSVLSADQGVWNANGAPITSTRYQWQSSSDGIAWADIPGASSETYAVGLYVGSTIRVRVTQTNEAGSTSAVSEPTEVISAIPAATPLLTSQKMGNASITLGWTPPIHAGGETLVGYTLEYSSDLLSWTRLSFGPSVASAVITGLTNGTPYFARVRAETDMPGEWSPIAGPFVPVAPPVAVIPPSLAPNSPTTTVSRTLLDSVMPVALTSTTLSSLTGPSGVTITTDGRIELQPTQSLALKNGVPLNATVTLTDSGFIVTTDTVRLALAFDSTTDHALTAQLAQGSQAEMTAAGFTPGSPVVTWIQSTPTRLGTATTDVAGVAQGSFSIPESIEPGPHTIQVNGVDLRGDVVSIIYGVEVQPRTDTVVSSTSDDTPVNPFPVSWFWWGVFAVLVTLAGARILTDLRRRKLE